MRRYCVVEEASVVEAVPPVEEALVVVALSFGLMGEWLRRDCRSMLHQEGLAWFLCSVRLCQFVRIAYQHFMRRHDLNQGVYAGFWKTTLRSRCHVER